MVAKENVLFEINTIAEKADEDTLRYLEEAICPFDHTYVLQKMPEQASSIITNPSNPGGIVISPVSLSNFVVTLGTVTLNMGGEVTPIHLNIYKCPICGRHYKGDLYRREEDNSVKFLTDEEAASVYEKLSDNIEDGISEIIHKKTPLGKAYDALKG